MEDKVINFLFNKDGLVDSHTDDTFSGRLDNIIEIITKHANGAEKLYKTYVTNKFVPLLKEHVVLPYRRKTVHYNWTSNNAESANHILNSSTQRKISSMPEFVETWKDIVVSYRKENEQFVTCEITNLPKHMLITRFVSPHGHLLLMINRKESCRDYGLMSEKQLTQSHLRTV